MKKQFRKFTIYINLLLIGLPHAGKACGPSLYADEARFALFRNGMDDYQGLEPFYYSENFLNSYSPDPAGVDYQRNCREWNRYTKGRATEKDIYSIQYETEPKDFIKAYQNKDWTLFSQNSFIQWLLKKENKAALDYLLFAKKVEFTQYGSGNDPWTEKAQSDFFAFCEELAQQAATLCRKTKSKFLKERYAFQGLKMGYYAAENLKNKEEILQLYPKISNSKSVILGWAQLFYGMMQPDRKQQTLYLLKAFDHSEEKKVFCYNHISLAELDSLLPAVKDKKTLANIYTMKAIKNYGKAFEELKKLYELDPESKYLPLLITREINKLEDWIWSPQILGFSSLGWQEGKVKRSMWNKGYENKDSTFLALEAQNSIKDKAYLESFRSFLEVLHAKNKSNKAFLELSIAHLYNVTGSYSLAGNWLQKMEKMNNNRYEIQRLIETTIAFAYTNNVTTAHAKGILTGYIKQLNSLNPNFELSQRKRDNIAFYYDDDTETIREEDADDLAEVLLLLSNRFKEQGDRVTAGLLYLKANIQHNVYDGYYTDDTSTVNYKFIAYFDRNATTEDMDQLLEWKHKSNKTDFELLLTPHKWAKDDFYKDLKGTLFIRQQKFREALAVFDAMDPEFWEKNYAYSQNLPVFSIANLGTLAPWDTKASETHYTLSSKKQITREIVALLDALNRSTQTQEQKAALHYLLGNCMYSLTYFGKAWMMMSYGRSANEGWRGQGNFAYYSFYPNTLRYGSNYYGCQAATEQYKLALALSADKERQAKCLLNLALCDDSRAWYQQQQTATFNEEPYRSPYLLTLKKEFRNTDAFSIALTQCPDVEQIMK